MDYGFHMSCPFCKTSEFTLIGDKEGWRWVRCDNCELAYINPLPTDEQLRDFYSKYPANYKNVKNSQRKISRFKRKLWPITLMTKGRRFLDVGCNTGFAAEAARQLGCDSHGIDLSDEAIEIASGLYPKCHYYHETIQSFSTRGVQFDIVSCSEVIEHLNDIDSFISSLSSLVAKNGILYLTTPDAGHFRVPNDFLAWKDVTPPEHAILFQKKHVKSLLEKSGFRVKYFLPMIKPSIRVIAEKL